MMLAFLFAFLGVFVTAVLAAALCIVVLNFMFDRTANKLLHKNMKRRMNNDCVRIRSVDSNDGRLYC